MSDLHPTLIKANIALYRGERAEALRFVNQYQNERPATEDPHRSMVLWLEAQAQVDDEMRVRLLYDLIGAVPLDDEYGQMAREYLHNEELYRVDTPRTRRPQSWQITAGATVLILIIGGLLLLNTGRGDVTDTADVSPMPTETTPPDLPDRSRALVAESFTARYDSGILQVTSYEDPSVRVLDTVSGAVLTPVAGARFYALELVFECRSGICNTPPEAALTLRTENDDTIPVRENAVIANETTFEPIALGRTTRGWLVFEVPALSRVETLLITPASAERDTPPIEMSLPQ